MGQTTKLSCITSAHGYYLVGDVPTACAAIANSYSIACVDGTASQALFCLAGFYNAGGYSAGTSSDACSACATVANAATVTCSDGTFTQATECNAGFKSSSTYINIQHTGTAPNGATVVTLETTTGVRCNQVGTLVVQCWYSTR